MRRVTCQKSVRYDMHARISPYVCLSPADGESSAIEIICHTARCETKST